LTVTGQNNNIEVLKFLIKAGAIKERFICQTGGAQVGHSVRQKGSDFTAARIHRRIMKRANRAEPEVFSEHSLSLPEP
jgi:hypothetical protein